MQPKIKGQKADIINVSFAGENKPLYDAIIDMVEKDRREKTFVICELLKESPTLQKRIQELQAISA